MDGTRHILAGLALAAGIGLATPALAPPPAPQAQARLIAGVPKPFPRLATVSAAELECLAANVYFEARGEPQAGRAAVAHVTLNRVGAESFPDTVCGVVRQGGPLGPCQFEWYCDGKPDIPTEPEAWLDALVVAYRALTGSEDPTGGALYFHHVSLNPSWAAARDDARVIGRHVFFRLKGGELGERQLAQAE
ncbi:MAG: cell wall hydrolase [Pseudomonadota bacterium]